MATSFVFHRPELARRMLDITLGRDFLAGDTGLFLAAPRRTGKSTFLNKDLVPAFQAHGVTPVYVDLWSDVSMDPAALLRARLGEAVQARDPSFAKAAKRAGLTKVGLGSRLSLDLSQGASLPEGATFTDVIRELLVRTRRPVVLVIDEAQHATTTEAGRNAMFALKSARDVLNAEASEGPWGNVNLGLVLTGSNRDKLASLVTSRSQPFFGSRITAFPLLGRDYVEAFVQHVNEGTSERRRLDVGEAFEAFKLLGSRPQFMLDAVNAYVVGRIGEERPHLSLMEEARKVQLAHWTDFEARWALLSPLQQAVLSRLVEQGDAYRPFVGASLEAYASSIGERVTASDAQAALEMLREKELVVTVGRGLYTLDDSSMSEWLAARQADDDGAGGGMSGGPG